MVEVKFTEQSIADLSAIAEYISKDSTYYAGLYVQKLLERTDILQKFPLIGRIVPEMRVRSIRELVEGNYRIIYRIVNKGEIHILSFHHSSRNLKKSSIKNIIKKNK